MATAAQVQARQQQQSGNGGVSITPSSSPAIVAAQVPPFRIGMRQDDSRYLNILVYGKHGVGKTTLLASAADVPQMLGILFIDAESGEQAIEDNPRITNNVHLIENRIRVTTFKQVAQIHDYLVQYCKDRDAHPQNTKRMIDYEAAFRGISPSEITEPTIYRTVMLDSITEMEKYNMYALLGTNVDKIPTGESGEIDVAQWDEFRKNNQMIQIALRRFRDLPMNFLAAAAEQYVQDENKRQIWSPALTGKLSNQVQGFFDIVGYMRAESKADGGRYRRMYVDPTGNWAAKNRRAIFKGSYFDDPNMLSIMKAIGLLKKEEVAAAVAQ